jgi:SAM-dependent methyltransferase
MVELLMERLPLGMILNLGAGSTGYSGSLRTAINVDRTAPRVRGSGHFVRADAAALPFRKAAFDGVLMKDILEHVADPIGVLQEVGRVSTPAAQLVVTTPRALPRAVWDDPTHMRGFTSHALVAALEIGGWHPCGKLRRLGGLPGAGRLRLEPHLQQLMRIPGLGHWFGTNWIAQAGKEPTGPR